LQNFVNGNEELHRLANKSHAALKEKARNTFDLALLQHHKKAQEEVVSEDDYAEESSEVAIIEDMPVPPSAPASDPILQSTFCADIRQPALLISPLSYSYILRHDLGTWVDVDPTDDNQHLIWSVHSSPFIQDELAKLQHYNDSMNLDSSTIVVTKMQTTLPDDVQISDLVRHDYGTTVGNLLEIIIPRKRKLAEGAGRAPRFQYLHTKIVNGTNLNHPVQDAPATQLAL